jgi:hypothetical protein
MTAQEIASAIIYLRKVFVGPAEIENFMRTIKALEEEYRRVRNGNITEACSACQN